MASNKTMMIALVAVAVAALSYTLVCDADETEASVVPMRPVPPVMPDICPEEPENVPTPEAAPVTETAEPPPMILGSNTGPVPREAYLIGPEPEGEEPEEVPEAPMPFMPMPIFDDEFRNELIRHYYESLLNLSLLHNSLNAVNPKEEEDEDNEDTQIVIIEETDDGLEAAPVIIMDFELTEPPIADPNPILYSAGDAIGPIF